MIIFIWNLKTKQKQNKNKQTKKTLQNKQQQKPNNKETFGSYPFNI